MSIRHIGHAGLYALAIALGKGTSLVMLPIITHALPTEAYGRLELYVALADIAGVILGFSLVDALFRFAGSKTSGKEQQQEASIIFGMCMILASIGFIIGQVAVSLMLALMPSIMIESELRILAATLSLTALIQVPLAWLRMRDKVYHYCLLFGGKTIIQAFMVWGALELGYGVLGILLAGLIVDTLLCVALCTLQYRHTGITISWHKSKPILPYNMPLILGALACCMLGSADRLFLVPIVGETEIAYYALAGKFALIVALLAEPYNMWWFPRRFAVLQAEGGHMKSAYYVMIGVIYIMCSACVVAIIAPFLITWLTPQTYHPATIWVPLLCGIAALHVVTNLMNIGVYIGNTGFLPTGINLFAAIIALTGYMILIPLYGIMGAVMATYGAFIIRFILFYHISQSREHIPYRTALLLILNNICRWRTRYA